jgi:dTDP-4-dehydrorhamnose reductase
MKILLTGASGLLGSAFAKAARRRKHDIIGITGSFEGNVEGLSKQERVDLRDAAAVERVILEQFPDTIVNCAAISSVGDCETNPQESHRLNVELPEQLATLCQHLFASLIHISSEQVFDGANPPFCPSSPTSPLNLYGKQKEESEKRVLETASEFATVLRLPLLNGNSLTGQRSLHEQLMWAWFENRPPRLFVDEIRQPCLADNAAAVMTELCERNDTKGLFHWSGATTLSRFAIGEKILSHLGLPPDWIEPATQNNNPKFAGRAPDLSLDLQPLEAKLKTRPQSFETQLQSLIIPKRLQSWYNQL